MQVRNDLLCAADDRKAVIRILLDPSAAFDTTDHDMLIACLPGTLLWSTWDCLPRLLIRSSAHTSVPSHPVRHIHSLGSHRAQCRGLYRLSCTPPHLVTLHTGMDSICISILMTHKEGYVLFCPGNKASSVDAVERINACVADMRHWMTNNKLQLMIVRPRRSSCALLSSNQGCQSHSLRLALTS